MRVNTGNPQVLATEGYCNFSSYQQTLFTYQLGSETDTIKIEAVVDQNFGESINDHDVQPSLVDDP